MNSTKLSPSSIKEVQEIVGSLLYYALSINNTILVDLKDLASTQSQPTEDTWEKIIWILNYVDTYPDVVIQ